MRNERRTWIVSLSRCYLIFFSILFYFTSLVLFCYCCCFFCRFFFIFILFFILFLFSVVFSTQVGWMKQKMRKVEYSQGTERNFIKLFKAVWKTYWIEWDAAKICGWTKKQKPKRRMKKNKNWKKYEKGKRFMYVICNVFSFCFYAVGLVYNSILLISHFN